MKTKVLFILCLLAGLSFLNAGLNKFFNYIPVPPDMPESQVTMFTAMDQIGWLFPLVAVVEIVGGILLVIPRFRALGALMLFPILVGIIIIHFAVAPEGLPMAFIIFAVCAWVFIENRNRFLALVRN